MQVFVVVRRDSAIDFELRAYYASDDAIEFARSEYERYRDPADDPLRLDHMSAADLENAGWLWYGCYSQDGDFMAVVSLELWE